MSQGTIEIKDRRSGFERRQTSVEVQEDRRVSVRRRNENLRAADLRLSLKEETGAVAEVTVDTPLTAEEEAQLKKLNERRAFQMQGIRTGTQRHEEAVKNGDELAFHQMPQGGYPTSQKNLHS